MKVLMLNGSPRKNGNIALAFDEMEQVFEKNGVEYEMDIRGCIACETCRKNHKCAFDDVVNELAGKFEKADGLNKFFTLSNMPVATSQYWNNIYGWEPGEGKVDDEGRQTYNI